VHQQSLNCRQDKGCTNERAVSTRYLRGPGDTSILIFLERLPAGHLPSELAVSTVSLAELSAGVHTAPDASERARRTVRVQRVEATFSPLPFDAEAARQSRARGRPDDRQHRGREQASPLHHEPGRVPRA
jgi:hypothetical protein